jgi:predicted Zn-dependent peptidase
MPRTVALSLALLLFASLAPAAGIQLDVREHVLDNGMRILLVPQPGVPRVVCHVYYNVGSVNERPGITGIAHLLEHMMFKGTEVVGVTDHAKDAELERRIDEVMAEVYRERFWRPDGDPERVAELLRRYDELVQDQKPYIIKDDLWTLYMKNGGTSLNASTSQEVTGYYVTLPSNKVELQMFLEADRMRSAVFREFYSEKDVVMEERRLSENRPGYLFGEQVNAAFYTASPYHWGVIGWMDDLERIDKADLTAFHERFYAPNNSVAVYVGDFDPDALLALAERYFGRIPRGFDLEPIRTSVPAQDCEKRIYGRGNAPTSLQLMFHAPRAGHADAPALAILADVLGSGGGGGGRFGRGGGAMTGRLPKLLIREKELAVSVSTFSRPQLYAGSFQLRATPRLDREVTPETLEAEIWAMIELVKQEGVTDLELATARNRAEADHVRTLSSSMGLARRLGTAALSRGWRTLQTDLEALLAVTNDDIKRVAATYLVKPSSVTAIYVREDDRSERRDRGARAADPAAGRHAGPEGGAR